MRKATFIAAAHDDVRQALKILAYAAAGGSRSKPTIAQLNEIVSRLENAEKFLVLAKPDEADAMSQRISDEIVRRVLSCTTVASGRSAIASAIATVAG